MTGRAIACLVLCAGLGLLPPGATTLAAQASVPLDRVLTAGWYRNDAVVLAQDRGAAGLWHHLVKLTTTASLLQTTAHPDDEHGDILTLLSRRDGVRTALLTLNRGEGGANALGPELFDGLGALRTEELILSGRYYGLDDQYFTTGVDYGFSKTLDEAYRSWDREALLEDMVRVIRLNRPLVVVSRFHGSPRDGHGHHQAAGDLTPEAVRAAGDPERFPRQITDEGLRPWQPRKLYRGGVREDEFHHLEVDAGEYSPWLGTSYDRFAAEGLALQRSQTAGRERELAEPVVRRYERLPVVDGDSVPAVTETDWFDGLDTSLGGLFSLTGETPAAGAEEALAEAEQAITAAVREFDAGEPSASASRLAPALAAVRRALAVSESTPEAAFLLAVKERQMEAALAAAVDLRLVSVAIDPADVEPGGFVRPTLGPVVEGQDLMVWTTVTTAGGPVSGTPTVEIKAPGDWLGTLVRETEAQGSADAPGTRHRVRHLVTIPGRTPPTRPPFYRGSVRENRYTVRDSAALHLPWSEPVLRAEATVIVAGEPVRVRDAVRIREADLPYGTVLRELTVVPRLSIRIEPRAVVAPISETGVPVEVTVEVLHSAPSPTTGTLRLERPRGWPIEPGVFDLDFSAPGERRSYTFRLTPPALEDVAYPLVAVATAAGRSHREGYQVIRHRDLETRRLYVPAEASIVGMDVRTAPNLRVGYVMGVGDQVPAAIRQLGADVTLLDDAMLESGDLAGLDAIVLGTRAYAVRPALYAAAARLLRYVEQGGNLVVLYQTQEFVPASAAPFPASLPDDAEEVSEEDAPVRLLARDQPLLSVPNRITEADFDGWIEQRGSKFFSEWDEAYTPLVETHDTGQADQEGVWLTAAYGRGRYTYCALALHRQLPWGVSGAYRILANLLSAGRE